MRFRALSSLLAVLACTLSVSADPNAGPNGGLNPPDLQPIINRANTLFSSGQFNDAARAYSEAIELSPVDYLLYYKRATAYYSLNRHGAALDDFEKVLSLTSNTFDNAHLMKARIHLKDGEFKLAQEALSHYTKAKGSDTTAADLQQHISEGQQLAGILEKERKSQLWTACVDSASSALRYASHSVSIRQIRAECALAAGDVESAVGDLTRLTALQQPSTPALTRIVRLAYFLLPSSQQATSTLKQCLHYDPDSKACLTLHRLIKAFERGFTKLEELQGNEDWRGIVQLLTSSGKNNDLLKRFDEALAEHTTRDSLLPPPSDSDNTSSSSKKGKSDPPIPLPESKKFSPRRQQLFRALCKAYIQLNTPAKAEPICEELLTMEGCAEDVDGLVGRGEALLKKQEYEEAVRVFERAFEASGRSSRDIHQRMAKAQKLLKQSKQKDYYKVLGVSRDADIRTIKKAFRQAAKTAHPDKGGSEAKMAAVNEAYEVLSDPELRARFDAGDDPNDPMSGGPGGGGGGPFAYGGGGGQHPFAQFFQGSAGGFPGGGHGGHGGHHGGFQFHF